MHRCRGLEVKEELYRVLVVNLQTNPPMRLKLDENKGNREEMSLWKWVKPASADVKADREIGAYSMCVQS